MMKTATKYVPVRIIHSHNSKLGETEKKEKRNALFLPFLLRQANSNTRQNKTWRKKPRLKGIFFSCFAS